MFVVDAVAQHLSLQGHYRNAGEPNSWRKSLALSIGGARGNVCSVLQQALNDSDAANHCLFRLHT